MKRDVASRGSASLKPSLRPKSRGYREQRGRDPGGPDLAGPGPYGGNEISVDVELSAEKGKGRAVRVHRFLAWEHERLTAPAGRERWCVGLRACDRDA
jgi:hypothetical protein